jgi:hypothetical protein
MRGALRASAAVVLLAVCLSDLPARAQVHSEFPALSRPLTTESFPTTLVELRDRLVDRGFSIEGSWLRLSGGRYPGGPGVRFTRGDPGGRLVAQYRQGRYALSGEAGDDGPRDLEPREYPMRLAASGLFPESQLSGALVAGFDHGDFAGVDLALESAPTDLRAPVERRFPADYGRRLVTWSRLRVPRHGRPSLTPATALVLGHLPMLASKLTLAPSVQSELRRGAPPVTALLLQICYAPGPWPLGGGGGAIRRGSRRPTDLLGNLIFHAGYARPLDHRSSARLVLGVGAGLDAVLGSGWPTSR